MARWLISMSRSPWFLSTVAFAVGVGVGALLLQPLRVPGTSRAVRDGANSRVVAMLRGRVYRARVHAALQPTWEAQAELLRHLCALREAELNFLTNWGERAATPAELSPSLEQEGLLDVLGRSLNTHGRRVRYLELLHRAVEMPAIAHGDAPG